MVPEIKEDLKTKTDWGIVESSYMLLSKVGTDTHILLHDLCFGIGHRNCAVGMKQIW